MDLNKTYNKPRDIERDVPSGEEVAYLFLGGHALLKKMGSSVSEVYGNTLHKYMYRCFFVGTLLIVLLALSGCFRYSFTGTSIPENVNTIYIPFFADQSSSGIGDLSDQLNQILVDRFVNQTKLRLANSRGEADAILEGQISSYSNRPFSVTGEAEADRNQVSISVRATFQFTSEDQPEWSKSFSGSDTFDPINNPIEGEQNAAQSALEQISNNMFNDAVSGW